MKAGECWIFDTWRLHRVTNETSKSRIHLVIDTVGGNGFWNLASNGRAPDVPGAEGWAPRSVASFGASISDLEFERTNFPRVMTPWEVREHVHFLLSELAEQSHLAPVANQAIARFFHIWRSLWSTYGESDEGRDAYRDALTGFADTLKLGGAEGLFLRNGANFFVALKHLIFDIALLDSRTRTVGEVRIEPTSTKRAAPAPSLSFDRPVFVVCPPRSGSTLLFETLAQAPDLYTVGGVLGHKSAVSTARYAHLAQERLREAVGKIGARAAKISQPGPEAKAA
jgi:hypothetical protein